MLEKKKEVKQQEQESKEKRKIQELEEALAKQAVDRVCFHRCIKHCRLIT